MGEIRFEKIKFSNNFWALYNELLDDKSGLQCNRTSLVDAFKNETLYGLRVEETDKLFSNRGRLYDPIFCPYNYSCDNYLLPCFCIIEKMGGKDTIVILWVHSRARNNKFGTIMVNECINTLKINHVYKPSPESTAFWEKFNLILN